MKLKKLIQDLPIKVFKGNKEVEITGLCSHSKFAAPGNLFISTKGMEGANHIEEAVNSGATAILSDAGNPFLQKVVQLTTDDIVEAQGKIAARYYSDPAKKMEIIGVTGTNGKTTTCYLIKHLLDHAGFSCGLIGSINYLVGDHHYPAPRTTPDVIVNQKLLCEMLHWGQYHAVMEVSSHGLMQGRVNEIDFATAIFTNLTHEHIDYHKTMEEYAAAKALLFSSLKKESIAVVPYGDPWVSTIMKNSSARVVTFGFSPKANIYADRMEFSSLGSTYRVSYEGQSEFVTSPLFGEFNVKNVLGAFAALLVRGIPLSSLVENLKTFSPPPGRLEQIKNNRGLKVFVDYAHKEEALRCVLQTLKGIARGKVITIFGCGGERDREKRPKMAALVEQYSDVAIVTNDNPRGEDPRAICNEILKGFTKSCYEIELDRKEAIRKGLNLALPGDVVLIAGKGHETTQIFANQSFYFNDRQIAEQLLET